MVFSYASEFNIIYFYLFEVERDGLAHRKNNKMEASHSGSLKQSTAFYEKKEIYLFLKITST